MKLSESFSNAIQLFSRRSREVFAIISLNGQAYFVFRSNPCADREVMIHVCNKIAIGNELCSQILTRDEMRTKSDLLYKFMVNDGALEKFKQKSQHAEENLIRGFPQILEQFKHTFPNQKITQIDIFLTHSPCSKSGSKRYSEQNNINGFFLPAGCDEKLSLFFKKAYKVNNDQLFYEQTKVKVYYNYKFDPLAIIKDFNLINEADSTMKAMLNI